MPSKLTIWCNAQFPEAVTATLKAGTAGHRLIIDDDRASNLNAGGPSPLLVEADVAFGQPDPDQIIELETLCWTQLTSAGYTRYDRPDLRTALTKRGAQLTNSSSVFDEPCAQHLLAFMLGQARQLPQSMTNQLGSRTWPQETLRPKTRLLANQTVVLLGFGAIARRLVQLLEPFHLNVIAFRQTVHGDEAIPVYPVSELKQWIGAADHVVNILPASPTTLGLVDSGVLEAMKAGAVFYNIGRGTTVDQEALIRSLTGGQLGAAYLDVTGPEPLPPDHPLWLAPNCFITPHIGGGHAEEFPRLVEHFLHNLKRYEVGEPLCDRVI